MCVFVAFGAIRWSVSLTHTHTHIYIYMGRLVSLWILIHVCVFVWEEGRCDTHMRIHILINTPIPPCPKVVVPKVLFRDFQCSIKFSHFLSSDFSWCFILVKSDLCTCKFLVVSQVVCFCFPIDTFENNRAWSS